MMQKDLSGRKKILILVKTYPVPSKKYDELVCTAGITEEGDWIRIYPVPFRKLPYEQQYKKYEWIEADISRNFSDFRPESYRITNPDNIKNLDFVPTSDNWKQRRSLLLNTKVFYNKTELINASKKENGCMSLALFKPAEIIGFDYAPETEVWDIPENTQLELFGDNKPFHRVKKLPYKFSYTFTDNEGKKSKLMIEDWETGMLYWNCLKKYDTKEQACKKVKEKYFDDFAKKKDLYFILGTTKEHHHRSRNPFIIIGAVPFPIKKDEQGLLF